VQKIAIYKNKLAVQLPNQLNVYAIFLTVYLQVKTNWGMTCRYELGSGGVDGEGTNSKLVHKIKKNIDCNLLVVCADNLILCQERRLQCLTMEGVKTREWVMDSMIRYIKVYLSLDHAPSLFCVNLPWWLR
jgi:intraflagellar transport protein 122